MDPDGGGDWRGEGSVEGAEREDGGGKSWLATLSEEDGGKLARCFTLMPNLELG